MRITFGLSLDGRIATETGDSRYINGSDALRHLLPTPEWVDDATKRWGTSSPLYVSKVLGEFPEVNRVFTSQACNHCESPACVENCPVGAIAKREEDGLVVVDQQACIGCQTCASVCPFGIPQYRPEDGKMDKCDGCVACGRGQFRGGTAKVTSLISLRLPAY